MTNHPLALAAPPQTQAKYSTSIPFLRRPRYLTGRFAGDVGFDPLGLASSMEQLVYYREAEVKHARIAMLAAAGWPLSELFDRQITQQIDANFNLNLSPVLDSTDRVPSLLNGGMDAISPLWWGFCLGLTAAIDLKGVQNARYLNDEEKSSDGEYFPGDYGFDPFNFYPADKEGQQRMQLAEIKHGRLSMLAVTGFAFQEYVSGLGVVDETPLFFQPLSIGGFN
ncbi:hypothetical protein HJC23_010126 [Cyclotella cryptica]|uniref:Uncharacterized protein n=1 Tax=Cyclotella cryptica TaxID=29204 RepID=A0ABD3P5H3_9STRA|eukprot:CCRYP_017488-RD/>CCRYP_017488-RD protein AED:0.34 eAED:0.34 QI:447/1/1/1/0.5/0.33/3/1446/223